ncbi:hypothetical protein M9H77_12536 [Catharanthus roseus]|uniref:Uncharacterized protein n=1 Tax=Catharanthus roseus TaxID=4058 RepID=A0ACC0BHP3_CATRO|nr:hypothetical protein M9H77_12536 [Catharanthus roseus]
MAKTKGRESINTNSLNIHFRNYLEKPCICMCFKDFMSFGDYLVTKCGVLMMSLFVFFTTTMSVSFTLRETQTRMLKFTVQLQHHARHRLPTFQLIFVHVIESLVFVPCPNTIINEILSSLLSPLLPGFSYLALSTTAAFMQHLILYFWNRFEGGDIRILGNSVDLVLQRKRVGTLTR